MHILLYCRYTALQEVFLNMRNSDCVRNSNVQQCLYLLILQKDTKMGKADKLRFMNIAQGSLEESRYYIILSKDLGYINESVFVEMESLINKTSWYLNAYCKGIMNDNALKQQ